MRHARASLIVVLVFAFLFALEWRLIEYSVSRPVPAEILWRDAGIAYLIWLVIYALIPTDGGEQ